MRKGGGRTSHKGSLRPSGMIDRPNESLQAPTGQSSLPVPQYSMTTTQALCPMPINLSALMPSKWILPCKYMVWLLIYGTLTSGSDSKHSKCGRGRGGGRPRWVACGGRFLCVSGHSIGPGGVQQLLSQGAQHHIRPLGDEQDVATARARTHGRPVPACGNTLESTQGNND